MTFKERYGPWALVTGASAGIGKEFAVQLAGMGLNLVLLARREKRIEDLAHQLESRNKIYTKTIVANLAQPDFLAHVMAETQSIDIGLVVNNAGFGLAGKFLDHDWKESSLCWT
jgi:uncharacterized protein